jgi:hypothetical protein
MAENLFEPLAYEVVTVTADQAPILRRKRLAHIALDVWREVAGKALRACAATPNQVHAVVEAVDFDTLERWVEVFKARSEPPLIGAIRRFYADDLLDAVTRYSPVWSGVVYRVWQEGYHLQEHWTEASVTKKASALRERGILLMTR